VRADRLTSVGGRHDDTYVTSANRAEFGLPDWPTSDPFDVYHGDEPLFRRSRADRWLARAAFERANRHHGSVQLGAEAHYDMVRLFELDGTAFGQSLDSVRTYRAYAPGGAAWVQSRLVFEGLVANLGGRLGWFSAGPQARAQSVAAGEGIDYRGASGKLDLGDDGELALGSSATFWRVKGDAVVEEAAGVCAPSDL
jgi:hypothetical protein